MTIHVRVRALSVPHMNIVYMYLPCITCMLSRSTSQHIPLCLNWASRDFFGWFLWSMFVPKSCIWCGESYRLTFFLPPSSPFTVNVNTNFFLFWFSEGCSPLHDCLHFTVCLFYSFNSMVSAGLCVMMKWGWFPKCIKRQIFPLSSYALIVRDHITSKYCPFVCLLTRLKVWLLTKEEFLCKNVLSVRGLFDVGRAFQEQGVTPGAK